MPRRTNTFQDVVATVQRHLAGDAVVEESAMVRPTRGGDSREVDVLITTVVAGHQVCVAVEASKTGRKATVEWVERMLGKHADLPTNKLILYSGAGYTKGALSKAAEHNVTTVAAEQMSDEERLAAVLGDLGTVWLKTYELTVAGARLETRGSGGEEMLVAPPADAALYDSDGDQYPFPLHALIEGCLRSSGERVIRKIDLRSIEQDERKQVTLHMRQTTVLSPKTGKDEPVYLRYSWEEETGSELHEIVGVQAQCDVEVRVAEVQLTHARLGDTPVTYGDFEFNDPGVGGGVVVATGAPGAERVTLKMANGQLSELTVAVSPDDGALGQGQIRRNPPRLS